MNNFKMCDRRKNGINIVEKFGISVTDYQKKLLCVEVCKTCKEKCSHNKDYLIAMSRQLGRKATHTMAIKMITEAMLNYKEESSL